MSKMLSLLTQDSKLLLRNAIFWVISVTLVLIIVTVNFLIPKDFKEESKELVVYGMDELSDGMREASSAQEVERLVKETGAIGLVMSEKGLTVVSDSLGDKAAAALVATLTSDASQFNQIKVETLEKRSGVIPPNLGLMPIFICFEAVILGFLMAAILMLGEKQDHVLKAYRVSPGGTLPYILSKVCLFVGVGSVYALLMVISTLGFHFDLLNFLILTVLGCILYTILGLSVAVFFKDISGWFFVAAVLLALNMLPMISYSMPSFSPGWIKLIPSYPMLFAYKDILFSESRSQLVGTYTLLACEAAAALGISALLIKKKLLSEQ